MLMPRLEGSPKPGERPVGQDALLSPQRRPSLPAAMTTSRRLSKYCLLGIPWPSKRGRILKTVAHETHLYKAALPLSSGVKGDLRNTYHGILFYSGTFSVATQVSLSYVWGLIQPRMSPHIH